MRTAVIAIAAFGATIAGYLTLAGPDPACVIAHGCSIVQSSRYAELGGVPVAALGLGAYLTILVAVVLNARTVAAAVALTGAGFSGWLTYVEAFRLEAICAWCVASAVCMTTLAVLCLLRMVLGASGVVPVQSTMEGS